MVREGGGDIERLRKRYSVYIFYVLQREISYTILECYNHIMAIFDSRRQSLHLCNCKEGERVGFRV